ncbi:hypothetical protein BDD12DRAFT_57180 [Trichophaea hybrida]|nr:hypothetical protein BDD12DRAFT_57180 [Trichophaea hybrida]
MSFLSTVLWISTVIAAAAAAALSPPQLGVPRLVGRWGVAIDVRDLADRNSLLLKRQSPDGTCGGINQYICGSDVNKCCSQYGWCGDTTDHCGTKCQPSFGTCTGEEPPHCGLQGNGTSCSATSCCSENGYCGTTSDACSAPGCQEGYGRCDADYVPQGTNTSTVARPLNGIVPYAEDIFNCVNPGDIALTYDDGPDVYTDGMLDVLASYGAKATFFVTGINNGKGSIDTTPAWRDVIRKMAANGHQIASHTWSHANLTNITRYSQKQEMVKLEMALRNILGYFPTYMRPPYSSCNPKCMDTMKELGYHVIYFNLDTDDYNYVTPQLIQNSKNRFSKSLNGTNPASKQFLVIAHDIHEQTATNLTEFMLQKLTSKGYRAVTLGECLEDPSENWYRTVWDQIFTSTTTKSATSPSTTSATITSLSAGCPITATTTSTSITTTTTTTIKFPVITTTVVTIKIPVITTTVVTIKKPTTKPNKCVTKAGAGVRPCDELGLVY